ncbi:hypothetical protein ABT369_38680 [Dactylosporangium sp. NPDC000244]|uniref:hypothetical protein n=1 Tax=Dactylosporangium sp. NPDC000244 TaxID=3154365 RepID=UPI00332CA632
MTHHATLRRVSGVTEVARPLRGTGWTQWRAERACRKTIGHCWHPDGMVGWWCCECSAATEGMPEQRCVHCAVIPAEPQECQGADFSKLLARLGANLEDHARRDGLSPVRTAIFLRRGGHAPGEHCPTASPATPVHVSTCSWLLGEECDRGCSA